MTATAYLRVYLLVETLRSEGLNLPEVRFEPSDSVQAAADVGLVRGSMREDVLIADWRGARYGCPRRPMLRAMEGLLAFRNAYAGIGGELLVPERVARMAADHLEAVSEQPLARSYILTSPWHVPLRWFSAFHSPERELFEANGLKSLRYRTGQQEAINRLEEVIGVLRKVGMNDGVVSEVEELAEWIGGYPAEALVELDYGSVACLFQEADLLLDESSADVWESITALASGDWEKASEHYMIVARRWAAPMAVAFSS
ncbi:MAG: hypothetical protein P1T08_10390 [Acidimicrobiia bacterium]|nr:hypothetical protein [Acidimicrobiia bacterium]